MYFVCNTFVDLANVDENFEIEIESSKRTGYVEAKITIHVFENDLVGMD